MGTPQIAADLDASEHALLAENGPDSEEMLRYLAEGSGNVADNGMFSVQVGAAESLPVYQLCASIEAARILICPTSNFVGLWT